MTSTTNLRPGATCLPVRKGTKTALSSSFSPKKVALRLASTPMISQT